MRYKKEYINAEDRERVLIENRSKILVEEQNLFSGNFLIFDDGEEVGTQLKEIKNNSEDLTTYVLDVDMRLVMFELGLK